MRTTVLVINCSYEYGSVCFVNGKAFIISDDYDSSPFDGSHWQSTSVYPCKYKDLRGVDLTAYEVAWYSYDGPSIDTDGTPVDVEYVVAQILHKRFYSSSDPSDKATLPLGTVEKLNPEDQ